MNNNYDVIIVGAGPAGIFTALELVKRDGLRVLMLEKGADIEKRDCPARDGKCVNCDTCDITSGWGGAGAFSDGKLSLSPDVGGWLGEYVGTRMLRDLIDHVDQLWLEFGAPRQVFGDETDKVAEWRKKAVLSNLVLTPCPFRHMGTERCREVLVRLRDFLSGKVEGRTGVAVESILVEGGRVQGVRISGGEELLAPSVVAAPGREGADWLAGEMARLGVSVQNNQVDIGVRVEVAAPVLEPLTNDLYEPKLHYFTRRFEDRVRVFCMNPYGQVCVERYGDVLTVNGHSYAERRTENTNFALLASTTFTQPFKEPIAYGKYIARLANLLGEGILVQRLGDLLAGRRSTPRRISRSSVVPTLKDVTPGDISFVLPYRYISDILEMLEALEHLSPGLYARDTLLYGVEVKFYSSRPSLGADLQSEIGGLYAIGDGAGITRGLMQASASGIVAARSILQHASHQPG
jgi:uncharacterized protein